MNKTTELILLAIVMSLVEAYCLFGAKKYAQDNHMAWYATAVMGYALIVLLIAHLSRTGKIGVINSVWNAISICTSIALGSFIFSEKLNPMEVVGVIAIVIGVVFIQIPC